MAELIFPGTPGGPPAPTLNQLFPDPAIAGVSQWRWDGARWVLVSALGGASVSVGPSPPPNPSIGDLWFCTDDDETGLKLYVWFHDGVTSQWVVANPGGGGGGGSSVSIGVNPPSNPNVGNLWWSEDEAQLYIWAPPGQWVVVINQPGGGGGGGGNGLTQQEVQDLIQAAFDAWAPSEYVTRQNRNRVINGGFMIQQWGTSGVLEPTVNNQYFADRFFAVCSQDGRFQAGVGDWNSPNLMAGATRQLALRATGSVGPAAGETYQVQQKIEFTNVADFRWGLSQAAPVTLSFWVICQPGVWGGSLCNFNGTRSYPFSWVQDAYEFQYVAISIPGDTSGMWFPGAANATGITLRFDLGTAESLRGSANTGWQSGNVIGANGARNFVALGAGQEMTICNVQLEAGPVATPFDFKSFTVTTLECYRYRYVPGTPIQLANTGIAVGAGNRLYYSWAVPVPMRTNTPTINASFSAGGNGQGVSIAMLNDNRTVEGVFEALAAGPFGASLNITSLTAEL